MFKLIRLKRILDESRQVILFYIFHLNQMQMIKVEEPTSQSQQVHQI